MNERPEQFLRRGGIIRGTSPWAKDYPPWPAPLPERTEGLGRYSFHPSGYAREAAVTVLAERREPAALRFLLPRVLDWVPQVRERAQAAVSAWLAPEHADAWFEVLPLWLELLRRAGQARKALVDPRPLLRSAECRPALLRALAHPVPRVRNAARPLANELLSLTERIEVGLADAQPSAQVAALEASSDLADDERVAGYALAALARGRGSRVRAAAMRRLAAIDHPPPAELVRDALLDASEEVRAMARFFAARAGVTDVAAYYRRLVTNGGRVGRAALVGLGEVGHASDVPLFEALAVASVPTIRRAALVALAAHAPMAPKPVRAVLVRSLRDVSAPVSGTARQALERLGARASEAATLGGFVNDASLAAHTRWNAFTLLEQHPAWTQLPHFLRALTGKDAKIAARALVRCARWQSSVRPDAAELAAVEAAFAALSPAFVDDKLAGLRLSAKAWQR